MNKEQQGMVLFWAVILLIFFVFNSPALYFPESFEKLSGERQSKLRSGEILVEVDGAVKKRGIYQMPAGSKITDILEKAGGIKGKISLEPEVSAQEVAESSRLYISGDEKGPGRVSVQPINAQKLPALSIPINVNKATIEELCTLPGIGPKTAQAIVEFRDRHGHFKSAEELVQVHGIGPKKLAAIRERITIQ